MGIGTKIKEALNPDRHNQYDSTTTTADTTKTPGSFPSDEVPRSHKYDGIHKSTHDSTLESKGEKLAGNHSPEYTYGQNSATTTDPDKLELSGNRRDDTLPGGTGAVGATGAHGAHGGNKLSKGHREPYWGDAGRPNSNEFGNKTTGAYDRNGNNLDANEINNRYNSTNTSRDEFAQRGNTTGRTTANNDGFSQNGISDISQSGNATGRTGAGNDNFGQSGMSGRGAIGQDTIHAGGVTSNLSHRPHDINNTARDYKTDEYDAPTNSSGRGKTAGAVGAGAAAGYGASELSNRHHEHDMREYDAAGSNRHVGAMGSGRNYDNNDSYSSPDPVSATSSMLDPHNQHFNQTTSTTGSSMLDPYSNNNKQSTTSTGHGLLQHHDKHSGLATAPNTSDHINNRNTARDSGFSHGAERDTSSIGSSSYGQAGQTAQGTSMGEDHFGPGHAGARVHHQCHNCGADNDISRYFRKDAVYRMS